MGIKISEILQVGERRFIFYCIIFVIGLHVLCPQLHAQDTTKMQTVQIISEYKPILREATKLSFSASPLPTIPFSNRFNYMLPDQQFRIAMKAGSLTPAVLKPDSLTFINHHFLKVGYGNFQRIFADAGTAWGAGKPVQLQLMAGYHALRGDLNFQENSRTYADACLQVFKSRHSIHTKASFAQRNFYLYGEDSANIGAKRDSLRLNYQQFGLEMDLSNNEPNAYGISYHPDLKLNYFNRAASNELNALFRLPFSVKMNNQVDLSLQLNADLTRFQPADTNAYTNHIVAVQPSVRFPYKDISFDVGGQLAWDQGHLNFLPKIGLEAFLLSNRAILLAGWKSSIQKNNYQQLAELNPWINEPLAQFNTRTDEVFGGLRGDLPFNLHYRFRAGIKNFRNLPLFINLAKPSRFDVVYEHSLQTFHIQGSLEWLRSEKFSAAAGIETYRMIEQTNADKPWHFIPAEISLSSTWRPSKYLLIQGKIFGWQGPYVQTDISGANKRLPAVLDANIEADLRIGKWLSVWLQLNNLLNQAYQRWYLYPVVGLQAIGGIRLNFEQYK